MNKFEYIQLKEPCDLPDDGDLGTGPSLRKTIKLSEQQQLTLKLFPDYRFGIKKEEFNKEIDKIGLSHQELSFLLKQDYLYYFVERDVYIITEKGWKFISV